MATVIENFNNDPKIKIRVALHRAWDKTKDVAWKLVDWAEKNKEISVPIALGVAGLLFDRGRQHQKDVRAQKELETKLRTVYDRHTGVTYYMNRVPNRKQQRQINQRLLGNEAIGDILDDLGLL